MPLNLLNNDVQTMTYPIGGGTAFILPSLPDARSTVHQVCFR